VHHNELPIGTPLGEHSCLSLPLSLIEHADSLSSLAAVLRHLVLDEAMPQRSRISPRLGVYTGQLLQLVLWS